MPTSAQGKLNLDHIGIDVAKSWPIWPWYKRAENAEASLDYTVWGFLSDALEYWFYQLDMQGEWSLMMFRSTRDGWQSITNIFATIILYSIASYSPLHPNLA